jgi:hypothetical protein
MTSFFRLKAEAAKKKFFRLKAEATKRESGQPPAPNR